ncbi:MAG: U32 family peptidase [Bacilli bacterium]|nr:U32 family peptidase [Bacilli bacterium]
MKRVELLAPAGDLDRLKLALIYGADAVYIGGKTLSLRTFASNFSLEDIKEGVEFAHSLNKKVYVACNMVLHDEDDKETLEYLKTLKEFDVDAIIISSLYLLGLAKSINLEAHMSTQLSILNIEAVKFFAERGSARIVLGRELSIPEIGQICRQSPSEIEVFIHGGMCSSYSGKCMLSNVMCERDPNRGGCAHSCRWKYHAYDENGSLEDEDKYLSISSKDLCTIKEIPALIESGVSSLKIEGRMKSHNYLAFIVSAYRKAIDDYYDGKKYDEEYYMSLISYGENRLTGHGFLHGNVTVNEMLFDLSNKFDHAGEFIGIVRSFDHYNKIAKLEVKNKIIKGDKYYVISPNSEIKEVKVLEMKYKDNDVEQYTIAGDVIDIQVDIDLKEYDLIHIIR